MEVDTSLRHLGRSISPDSSVLPGAPKEDLDARFSYFKPLQAGFEGAFLKITSLNVRSGKE